VCLLYEVFGVAGDDFDWKFLKIIRYEFIYKKVSAVVLMAMQV
jgi:hypothetical protein